MTGVFVCGTSRSGTSMTAGLFAAHGVFFGNTFGPHAANRKGNLENAWLKKVARTRNVPKSWPESWFRNLQREGWDKEAPWGAKLGPESWFFMRRTNPTVVVRCWRPVSAVYASRRVSPGWGRRGKGAVEGSLKLLREIDHDRIVDVATPELVAGDLSAIAPAFEALGIEFDPQIAEEWIDPNLWHHE